MLPFDARNRYPGLMGRSFGAGSTGSLVAGCTLGSVGVPLPAEVCSALALVLFVPCRQANAAAGRAGLVVQRLLRLHVMF